MSLLGGRHTDRPLLKDIFRLAVIRLTSRGLLLLVLAFVLIIALNLYRGTLTKVSCSLCFVVIKDNVDVVYLLGRSLIVIGIPFLTGALGARGSKEARVRFLNLCEKYEKRGEENNTIRN